MPTEVSSRWSTLAKIQAMAEDQRKRVLRFHREAGPGSIEDRPIRRALDDELGELGRLELQAQAGSARSRQRAIDQIQAVYTEFRVLFLESPAFAHYLESYLYFKIRFAIGRFDDSRTSQRQQEAAGKDSNEDWNERPIGLPAPPPCGPQENYHSLDPDQHSALLRWDAERDAYDAAEVMADVQKFLGLKNSHDAQKAIDFLDDYVAEAEDTRKFDLWLRRLFPSAKEEQEDQFRTWARGLYEWARQRYEFYLDLERRKGRSEQVNRWLKEKRAEGTWHARNPLAARCAVTDLYWLARILRAEVSPRGVVNYVDRSWLYYLPALSSKAYPKEEILRIEDVLRAAFNYGCELIQNAVEMAEYCERKDAQPDDFPDRPSHSDDWRAVQDNEIAEIGKQRRERFVNMETAPQERSDRHGDATTYWSERIETGQYEENLVGVALSGGGIRSATFALGVLQRLKELDVLRQVDYLSTVSGGGYIGSWVLGNVRRTRYFLSRMTSWEESIGHLRNYSKYLAPQSGFLSADTWVMWGTWIRNAMLIQLTTIACLWTLFVGAILLKAVFTWIGLPGNSDTTHVFFTLGFIAVAAIIVINLTRSQGGTLNQHRGVVLLAWAGSFASAALLWGRTLVKQPYSNILATDYRAWPSYVGPALLMCMLAFGAVSVVRDERPRRPSFATLAWSVIAAILSAVVIYVGLAGVRYLFGVWASSGRHEFVWYAYVFGAPLVLLAITLAVVVFIGLIGHSSADWRREWWTRYGSWLAIYGAGFLALSLAAVFGYAWLANLWNLSKAITWSAVGGWIGSTVAALLAGNSGKTKGNGTGSSPVLEWVAKIGGFVFIAGALLISSSVLRLLLVQIWLDDSSRWWNDLNLLLAKWPRNEAMWLMLAAIGACALLFSWRFNLNIFGLNQFYRNRLVRCYLGATRWKPGLRRPDRFTGFDEKDDLRMTELQFRSPKYPGDPFRGPFPIVNCALNLGGSSDLTVKTRQSACFTITPLSAGACRTLVGYVPVEEPEGSGGTTLGQAISISGAAASPNMGYNTSPLVSILLTMFNVRLAWWFPNPGRKKWQQAFSPLSILYLVQEFLGLADETSNYVNISDGGHFENMAIYELIRRRVKVIIASDGECDSDLTFGSLGNVIRICETDFGAKIEIDVTSIRKQPNGKSRAHCAVGRISYSNGSIGYLIYLKASITGDEDADIEQYRAAHPDFPHQSTGDQFFTEDQFESYRRLGDHIAKLAFRDAESGANLVDVASKLYDVWTPGSISSDAFVKHTAHLDQIWERMRTSTELLPLFHELMADRLGKEMGFSPSHEEIAACMELIQLMENVFLDLRLDDFWNHPDNRGWAMLFAMWAKSPTFRAAWRQSRRTFGIRFEYFCHQHLGLEREQPVVRV